MLLPEDPDRSTTPLLLRTIAARMQMRVDAILERDREERVAIEGRGMGISFLFAREIVQALEAGHDEIERQAARIATLCAERERVYQQLMAAACEGDGAMSERWRDTYDQWKMREPDADARVCDVCGGWLRFSHSDGWYCEACDERDAALADAPGEKP